MYWRLFVKDCLNIACLPVCETLCYSAPKCTALKKLHKFRRKCLKNNEWREKIWLDLRICQSISAWRRSWKLNSLNLFCKNGKPSRKNCSAADEVAAGVDWVSKWSSREKVSILKNSLIFLSNLSCQVVWIRLGQEGCGWIPGKISAEQVPTTIGFPGFPSPIDQF